MPNSPSARKRVRQNEKRRALNNWRIRRVKSQLKKFLKAVHDQDAKAATAEYRSACGLLDKIACTGTIHRNAAARHKSRMARKLKALTQSAGAKA